MRNGWGGRLCNVGGAYLFFLHSLMGKKKKKFVEATAPPSHYVAPPLLIAHWLLTFPYQNGRNKRLLDIDLYIKPGKSTFRLRGRVSVHP